MFKILNSSEDKLLVLLGNTCNMMCMYCDENQSSQWAHYKIVNAEISSDKFKFLDKDNNKKIFYEILNAKFKDIKEISPIGGEPSLMSDFYELCDNLIILYKRNPSKKKFWVSTNLQCPSKQLQKFIDKLLILNSIFDVEVNISIDSLESRAEYIRYGLNWVQFVENLDLILKTDLRIFLLNSLNILNVTSLENFLIFFNNKFLTFDRKLNIHSSSVNNPVYLSPYILTKDFTNHVDIALNFLVSKNILPDYQATLAILKDNIDTRDHSLNRKNFGKWIMSYDERTKLDRYYTFPEYKDFFNYCNVL